MKLDFLRLTHFSILGDHHRKIIVFKGGGIKGRDTFKRGSFKRMG